MISFCQAKVERNLLRLCERYPESMGRMVLRSGRSLTSVEEPEKKRMKQSMRLTRSKSEVYLVGYPSASITGSRLPTKRQAFQYFLNLQNDALKRGVTISNQALAYDTIDSTIWHASRR